MMTMWVAVGIVVVDVANHDHFDESREGFLFVAATYFPDLFLVADFLPIQKLG